MLTELINYNGEILIGEIVHLGIHNLFISPCLVDTVEVCRDNPDIDLILMNIRIPGMCGYEAFSIKLSEANQIAKIIYD